MQVGCSSVKTGAKNEQDNKLTMPFAKGGKIKRGSTVLATKHARRENDPNLEVAQERNWKPANARCHSSLIFDLTKQDDHISTKLLTTCFRRGGRELFTRKVSTSRVSLIYDDLATKIECDIGKK
jgi:hypothetical protein